MGGSKNCVVRGCMNKRSEDDLPEDAFRKGFHKFPSAKTDAERRQIWAEFCERETGWEPRKNHTICSDHFHQDQFRTYGPKNYVLKPTAVPKVKSATSSSMLLLPFVTTPKPLQLSVMPSGGPMNQKNSQQIAAVGGKVPLKRLAKKPAPVGLGGLPSNDGLPSSGMLLVVVNTKLSRQELSARAREVQLPLNWTIVESAKREFMFFALFDAESLRTLRVVGFTETQRGFLNDALVPKILVENEEYVGDMFNKVPIKSIADVAELIWMVSRATVCVGPEEGNAKKNGSWSPGCSLLAPGTCTRCVACQKRIPKKRTKVVALEETESKRTRSDSSLPSSDSVLEIPRMYSPLTSSLPSSDSMMEIPA